MARRRSSSTPKPRALVAAYGQDNFEEIAAAIGVQVEDIRKHAKLFEGAARWYRLDRARLERTAPSSLRRKLDQIAKSARRLLKNLSVVALDEAADGPGDPEILDALILVGERDPTPVVEGTRRIARLVEIVEAVAARLNWDVAQRRRLPRLIKSER